MRTVDIQRFDAPMDRTWALAHEVEKWGDLLPHYRHVNRLEGTTGGDGLVEMSAWRPFGGPLNWPTWWCSRMWVDHHTRVVRYKHVAGITTGMDVWWTLRELDPNHTEVTIVHEWTGPGWPLIGGLAASWVIGPVFVHGIASRTLAGLAAYGARA
ncbi:MAG: SRPBCC family protein [Gemmatimonadota bacterium]